KAQQLLQEINGDGWLIICNEKNDINSRYMLGVESHALHYIFIAVNGDHHIFPVEMEANMIRLSLKNKGIKAKVTPYKSVKELVSLLKSTINKPRIALNFGEYYYTSESTSYADFIPAGQYLALKDLFPKTEFISAAPIIYGLRSVKTQEELNDLRNVCKSTIEIIETVPNWIKPGMTEKEVRAYLEYEYLKLGKPSFDAIVANNVHSADPHHNSSNKKIEPGVLLIDTGLQIDEMCSDITWTFWIGGNPPEDFIQAYQTLYESKKVANKYFTDGTKCKLPAIKCREYLAENGYDHEKLFFHGLGHALGFKEHDIGPRISWQVPENYTLKENMVYTNEPGLYWLEKWGIRLEDDIIIGKEKCEQVTYVSKDPIVI
ncbi:MAG: M24 family metallopeptidase, partial [Candidatus Hodarchaeota archaeon]